MELAIPLVALGGLYIISNQNKTRPENFTNNSKLPNVDIPDKNYPNQPPIISMDTDATSKLATLNHYDTPSAYTDKYFNSKMNDAVTQSYGDRYDKANSYKSLSGKTVDTSYFTHNNMVPYFGSHVRSMPNANSSESILDNMTGAGSQTIDKKEQAPLFSPGTDLGWATGTPNVSDFYQSRVNPSLKISNVKPFEEQRVAPGLGLGYGTEGAGGFNSGMLGRELWQEKTVDELRVATNPKSTFTLIGHEGPADSYMKNRGMIGNVEKNRQDTAFEMGADRLFTTTGMKKERSIFAEPIDRYTTRPETAVSYSGVAGASNPGTFVTGEYMDSKHIDLGSVPFAAASAVGKGGAAESDYGVKTKVAYPNNRSYTNNKNQDGYFGVAGGVIGEAVAPLLDMLRPSRKENTVGSIRPYQNARGPVNASYVFNPTDTLPTTMREMTEKSKNHLNINANQNGGGYLVAEQQDVHTFRQDTSDYYYSGNSSAVAGATNMPTFTAERNQRNNDIKSATIDGRMVPGNMKLMNGDITMRVKSRDDVMKNNRSNVATPTNPQTPSVNNMGRLQGGDTLYKNIQMDRNTADITNTLKGNPYALQYKFNTNGSS
jgi:hypothetical protein